MIVIYIYIHIYTDLDTVNIYNIFICSYLNVFATLSIYRICWYSSYCTLSNILNLFLLYPILEGGYPAHADTQLFETLSTKIHKVTIFSFGMAWPAWDSHDVVRPKLVVALGKEGCGR